MKQLATMPKCKRCGLPTSGGLPYGMDLEYEQLNPDNCAWCNALLQGRVKTERSPDFHDREVRDKRQIASGVCSQCGSTLFQGSGCYYCQGCGYEKC